MALSRIRSCSLLLLAALPPFWAQAQSAGSWSWQGGVTRLSPHVGNDTLSAPSPTGTTVGLGGDTRPKLQLNYAYSDQLSIAIPIGMGFKHKVYGTGAIAGVGQIGTVSVTPMTVWGQYRFGNTEDRLRPYAMLGASYARFHDAAGSAALNAINPLNPVGGNTGLKVDSKWGLGSGLGMVMKLDATWFMDLSYARTFINTRTTLSTGQSLSTHLDTGATSIGFGRKF